MAFYSEHLFQAERKVADADEKIKALTEELKTTQSRSKQLSDDWEAKNKELLEIEKRPDYVEYSHKLQERNESQPSLTLWEQQLTDNEKLIADFGGKIDAAGKEKVQMEEQGLALSQEASLTEKVNALLTKRNALDALWFSTIQYIHNNCKVEDVDKDTLPEIIISRLDAVSVKSQNRVRVAESQQKLLDSFKNLLLIAERYNVEQKVKKRISDLEKQIVITTHDKNFFQLLQKKMPQDRFNACYLRLKERGKFTVVES